MPPRSSGSSSSPAPRRPSGEQRVFAAPDGQLWGASERSGPDGVESVVLVFTCMTEARHAMRAVAIDAGVRLWDMTDDALRAWLAVAPMVRGLG